MQNKIHKYAQISLLIKLYESKLDVDNIKYYKYILETLLKVKARIKSDIEDCFKDEYYVIDLKAYKLTKKEFKEKK